MGSNNLCGIKYAGEIDIQNLLPLFKRHLYQAGIAGYSGIVYQNIDLSKSLQNICYGTFDNGCISNIDDLNQVLVSMAGG